MANLPGCEQGLAVGTRYTDIRISLYTNDDPGLEERMVKEMLDKNDQSKYWNLVSKHPGMRDTLDSLLPIKCLCRI